MQSIYLFAKMAMSCVNIWGKQTTNKFNNLFSALTEAIQSIF